MGAERKKIRNLAVTLLLDSTNAKENVTASKTTPYQDDALPAINILTFSESVSENHSAPRSTFRGLSLVVEITTKGLTGAIAIDAADDIAQQVEDIFDLEDQNVNGVLGSLIEYVNISSVNTELVPDGNTTVCGMQLAYEIRYTKEANTEDLTTELNRIGADWDVGTANDPDPEAADLIELR